MVDTLVSYARFLEIRHRRQRRVELIALKSDHGREGPPLEALSTDGEPADAAREVARCGNSRKCEDM